MNIRWAALAAILLVAPELYSSLAGLALALPVVFRQFAAWRGLLAEKPQSSQ